MIKIIVFDFDGVIIDNYELHYQLSTKQIKDLTREEHRKLFEGNIHEERAKLKSRNTGFDLPTAFQEHKLLAKTPNKIKKLLLNLSQKYILGIISSALEVGLNSYIKNNSLTGVFSFVYGKETHTSKFEKFKLVTNKFNVKNEEIIFVTDTLGDILEANKVKIRSIAVDFGYHERARLEKGKPFAIISSFDEFESAILKIK